MPKRRSLSKGLPKGLRRMRRGGPLFARRFDHESGKVVWRSTGKSDSGEAIRLRDQWQDTIDRVRKGLPTAEGVTPSQSVRDYMDGKRNAARKRSPQHIAQTEAYLMEFLADSKLERLTDLTIELVARTLEWRRTHPKSQVRAGSIASRREERAYERAVRMALKAGQPVPAKPGPKPVVPLSSSAIVHRQTALKGWSRWLSRRGILARDPLAELEKPDHEPRRPRGGLIFEEQRRLIEGAGSLRMRYGMTGVERQAIYIATLSTGLRLAELLSTNARHWRLGSVEQVEHCVELQHTKNPATRAKANVEAVTQPLLPLATATLRAYLATRDPDGPAFSERLHKGVSAKMVRDDLEALGIPTFDEHGVRDFHALRSSYATLLGDLGFSPMEIILLTRHKDTRVLTNHYAKNQVRSMATKAAKALAERSIGATFPVETKSTQANPNEGEGGSPVECDGPPSAGPSGTSATQTNPKQPSEVRATDRNRTGNLQITKLGGEGAPQDSDSGAYNGLASEPSDARSIRAAFVGEPKSTTADVGERPAPCDTDAIAASVDAVHGRALRLVQELGAEVIGGNDDER